MARLIHVTVVLVAVMILGVIVGALGYVYVRLLDALTALTR
jgi:hypothetical protein